MVRPDRLPDRIVHTQRASSASGSLFGKHHGDVGLGNCQPLAILKRRGTDLTKTHLGRANLTDANLTGAIWTDAYLLPYYTDSEPNWHSDMDQAWRDSAGILAIDVTSDGIFDAADYTVWQKNGGDQINYRTWKDHFGKTLPPVPGDYNLNEIVDAADYTLWQDNLGLDTSVLNGNGLGAATVVQDDYFRWRYYFGNSLASGSEADHVPEPTTLLLALLALVAVPLRLPRG